MKKSFVRPVSSDARVGKRRLTLEHTRCPRLRASRSWFKHAVAPTRTKGACLAHLWHGLSAVFPRVWWPGHTNLSPCLAMSVHLPPVERHLVMSTEKQSPVRYQFESAEPAHTDAYLTAPIIRMCKALGASRVLDLGCGNGALCGQLVKSGFTVAGCDPSEDGIRFAKEAVPAARFTRIGVDDDPAELGERDFDVVVSTEVVEHLIVPSNLPQFAFRVLKPGGYLIVSTPYHGYLKNLVLSITNKWDVHHTPFWDGGHIKFWSPRTLTRLIEKQGFRVEQFLGVGRLPYLWKSMILVGIKSPRA